MASSVFAILVPQPLVIQYGEIEIQIREIAHPNLFAFLELVSAKATALMVADQHRPGKVIFDFSKLPDLVRGSRELSESLLAYTTDVKQDVLKTLPSRVVVILLDKALELNLTEEFIGAGKSLVSRLSAVMPSLAKKESEASTSPSAPTATPSLNSSATPTAS